jgi:peptidoglycan/xylan/chitin deacetylase (PgdA/CDA1 family)
MSTREVVKRAARHTVAMGAYYSGFCGLVRLLGGGRGARILCYHSVSAEPRGAFAVSTTDFAAQMKQLRERCALIGLDELGELVRNGGAIPEGAVAVTIDDGFRDAFTNAFPVLASLKIPATIFLPVALIGRVGVETRLPQKDFLSWAQVREMRQNGVCFGSHSLTHVSLKRVTHDEACRQLEDSKEIMEQELGEPIRGFSYPYGTFRDWDREVEEMVEAAGYAWAVAGISGLNYSNSDPFALRRTKVERDDGMPVFEKILSGALDSWILVDRFGTFLQGRNR